MKILLSLCALLWALPSFAAPAKTPAAALKQTLSAIRFGDRAKLAGLVSSQGLRLVQTYPYALRNLSDTEKDEVPESNDNPREIDSNNRFLNRKQAIAAIKDPKNSRMAMLLGGKAFLAEGGRFVEMKSLAPRDFAALKWTKKGSGFFAKDKNGGNYHLYFVKENGFKLRVLGYYWPFPTSG